MNGEDAWPLPVGVAVAAAGEVAERKVTAIDKLLRCHITWTTG